MRDYSKVGPNFWIGATGKRLRAAGMEAQVVAMYLMTGPHANMLGLYYCPVMFIAHETGLGFEGASKGLARAIEAGFCEYDHDSEVVWVVEMASYQIGDALDPRDKRARGVQNEYDSLPRNPYLARFFDKYGEAFCMSACRETTSPFEAPSKPLRSQEQEQEQEQEIDNSLRSLSVGRSENFDLFWSAYPKKAKRKQAEAIWRRKRLDSCADRIANDIAARLALDRRWREGFIPDPTTYLNGERWEDEIDEGGNHAGKGGGNVGGRVVGVAERAAARQRERIAIRNGQKVDGG